MRKLLFLLVVNACLLLLISCATFNNESIYLTPVTYETLTTYGNVGSPVKNKLDAVIVAQIWMQGSRIGSVGDTQVVYAEQINLLDAYKKIGWGEQLLNNRPKDKKVWLVIFEGEWQLMFPVPDEHGNTSPLPPPFHGCQFSLFAADNGEPIGGGDVACPTE